MIRSVITQSNPAVILARVVDQSGSLITQSDIASIEVDVFDADQNNQISTTSLAVTDCVYDTCQLDARWTTDSVGFNLAVEISGASFPAGQTIYQVQVMLTPHFGNPFRVLAIVETVSIFS